MVFGPLNSSLIYILILLMLHYLIHHKQRRGWHREGKIKQELSQLRMSQEGDWIVPDLRNALALATGDAALSHTSQTSTGLAQGRQDETGAVTAQDVTGG
jgi:hypothetical protein